MRLISVFVLLLSLSTVFAPTAFAQGQKVLVVDLEKVMTDSIAGKAARNNFEDELKKRQSVIDKGKVELEKAKSEFEKQSSVLSGDALSDKRESLSRKEKDLARTFQDQREELAKRNQAEIGRILKQVQTVVTQIAEEKGAALVLEKDRRSVLFNAASLDMTEDVIKALDKKITK